VDLLGDIEDEVEEWSQDHDDQHVYDETRPFAVHELARQHVPPRNFSNPSLTLVAFASKFSSHNNIYNAETIAWHIQKGEHQYEEYLRMFQYAQAIVIRLKSQST
jgi:hypothetical protein